MSFSQNYIEPLSFASPSPSTEPTFAFEQASMANTNTGSQPIRRKPTPSSQDSSRTSANSTDTRYTTSTTAQSVETDVTIPADYSKKIVVVGDGGCGKTCLLISYSQGYFPEKYVPTVFENYITHTRVPNSHKVVELALWDTAGQEEYDRLRPLSYPETDLLFVCFAIDCPNSLENVMDKWYPEVLHFCPTTPLILVGLKSDLREKRTCIDLLRTQGLTPVTVEQGSGVAARMGARYVECSSKEMIGVTELFDMAVTIAVGADRDDHNGKGFAGVMGLTGRFPSGGSRGSRRKRNVCKIL